MSLKNTAQTYGGLTRFIHWVTAALIVVMIPLGLYMGELDASPFKVSLFFIHKSLGFFVLALTAARLVWMITNPKPALLGELTPWERKLAHAVHGLFYIFLFGVPLAGWMMSSAKGYPVSVYGWFTLPDLVGKSHALGEFLEEVHEIGAWGLVGLLALHLAGVWKHEGVYKDDTLSRIMPRRKLWFLGLPLLLALAFAPAIGMPLSVAKDVAADQDQSGAYDDDRDDDHADDENGDHSGDAMRWAVDYANSRLQFVATIEGAEMQGGFNDYEAEIRFSPEDLEHSRADVRVNLASVDTGNAERDDALRSPAWFSADKYPTARFEADEITHKGGNEYLASGELKIRGIERDAAMPFTLDIGTDSTGVDVAVMHGELVIDRTAFKLGQNEWEDAATVAHEVRVEVDLRALGAAGDDDAAGMQDDAHNEKDEE